MVLKMKKRTNKEKLARTVYRKLKHLHRVQWDTYSTYSTAPGTDIGVWHTIVIVPCFDVMFSWYSESNQLQVISIEDKNIVATFYSCNFKLFIKTIKRILRSKTFKLIFESF